MATIGLISDTHGIFDSKVPGVFSNVEQILHAGDIGKPEIIEQLEAIAPVTAVSGNVDDGFWADRYADIECVEVDGRRLWMTHICGFPPKTPMPTMDTIRADLADVVIFGHTHQPGIEEHEGILFINPGPAGPRRFNSPRTVALLEVGEELKVELVELDQ